MTALYYRHSENFSSGKVLLAMAITAAAAVPSAALYAAVTRYVAFIPFLNLPFALVLGAAVGASLGYLLVRWKVRSARITFWASLTVGLFTLYCAWGFWVYLTLKRIAPYVELRRVLHPIVLRDLIGQIYLMRGESQGLLASIGLISMWSGEALAIVGLIVLLALAEVYAAPFCEVCGVWCRKHEGVLRTAGAEEKELLRRIEEKDFAFLISCASPGTGSGSTCTVARAAARPTRSASRRRRGAGSATTRLRPSWRVCF